MAFASAAISLFPVPSKLSRLSMLPVAPVARETVSVLPPDNFTCDDPATSKSETALPSPAIVRVFAAEVDRVAAAPLIKRKRPIVSVGMSVMLVVGVVVPSTTRTSAAFGVTRVGFQLIVVVYFESVPGKGGFQV